MVIQLEPGLLINMFVDFVGNAKTMFNFRTDGKTLDVQMLGDYTATKSFAVTSIDGDTKETDISVWVNKFIHVMNKDEYIRITINDAAMFIEQNTFNCTLLREYEARRELPDINGVELTHAFPGRLKYLAHAGVTAIPLAKELSIPDPDPVFANNKFYMNYRQTAYIDSMKYPEMCIPFSTFRDFVFKMDDKATYAYLQELNTVFYRTKDYDFYVPTTNYNISNSILIAFDKKLSECSPITKIVIKPYKEKLLTVSSAFPKQKLTLVVGTGTFAVSADTNNSHMQVGYEMKDMLLSTEITSAQLTVITRLFGEDDEVIVKRGVGCICLNTGEKNLLIAGMIY